MNINSLPVRTAAPAIRTLVPQAGLQTCPRS